MVFILSNFYGLGRRIKNSRGRKKLKNIKNLSKNSKGIGTLAPKKKKNK